MRIKLDENLGADAAALLREAGHDLATVYDEGIISATDQSLIQTACAEERCLVTLDLEFANPLLFRPSDYFGVAVLRLPSRLQAAYISDAVRTLVAALQLKPIRGKLWIIELGRVREYEPLDSDFT